MTNNEKNDPAEALKNRRTGLDRQTPDRTDQGQGDELHHSILQFAMDGFVMTDQNGCLLEVNQTYCRMSGYSAEQLLTMRIDSPEVTVDGTEMSGRIQKIIATGGQRFEVMQRRKDGSIFTVEASAQYLDLEGGRIVLFLRDITAKKKVEQQLRETESRLRTVTANAPDTILQVNRQGIIEFVNRAVHGMATDQFVGTSIFKWVPPDYHPVVARALEEAFATGHSQEYETAGPGPHGQMRYYNVRVMPVLTEGQSETAIYFARDISEQRRTDELLDSQFKNSPDIILIIDRDFKIEVINRIAAGDFTVESLKGQDAVAALPPKEQDAVRRKIQFCFETGEIQEFEHGIGDGKWVRTRVVPMPEGNTIARVMIISSDITERKQAVSALRQNQEELAEIFAMSLDMICMADINTATFLKVNPAFTKTLGFTEQELINRPFLDFIHPGDLKATRLIIEEKLKRKEEVLNFINRYRCKDGSYRYLEWFTHPDPRRGITFSVARDITERRRAEEERERLQTQLAQAQKMESVGRLAGGVAHDFNNMLGVILGYAEMALEQTPPDQPLHDELMEIHNAAKRSAELTQQLLAFARKQTIAPKMLDLNETVERMLKMLRRLIGEDIDLVWMPGKNLGPIKMDLSQIHQILANLCINARDAVGRTKLGKVIIETSAAIFDEAWCAGHTGFLEGEFLMLAVSDNGCGMDSHTCSHLFEPFFTTKEIGKGTGLGLATVYGIVGQNNGFIDVSSKPGRGSTFKIYLPCLSGAVPQPEAEAGKQILRGDETILLVEDEPALMIMTMRMLTAQGYTVLIAGTPTEAIRLAQENAGAIHLLITDVVMPEMNGRDLANAFLTIFPDIKCLFMSGYTADVIGHHGVMGANVLFLQKPFTHGELIAKVRQALDQG